MNLKLLIVLSALFLTACAGHTVRDDSPASDLDALVSSVGRDLKTRTLPNGKEYCAELAKTEDAQDECTGDLEDGFWAGNRDKERAMATLRTGVERIKLALSPCRWFQWGCKRRAAQLGQAPPQPVRKP